MEKAETEAQGVEVTSLESLALAFGKAGMSRPNSQAEWNLSSTFLRVRVFRAIGFELQCASWCRAGREVFRQAKGQYMFLLSVLCKALKQNLLEKEALASHSFYSQPTVAQVVQVAPGCSGVRDESHLVVRGLPGPFNLPV